MTTEKTEKRVNRFNGESIMLTKEEAKRHDQIFIDEVNATLEDYKLGRGASKHWESMRKNLDWFRQHNAKAYMVLLDQPFLPLALTRQGAQIKYKFANFLNN